MASINWRILLFLTITLTKLSKSDDLILAKQDIIHPTSGLILQYKSDYRPANKIVTLSTVIPMVADMCYLIPISALKKIPRCNLTNSFVNRIERNNDRTTIQYGKRIKRFLTDIVSIGIGTAALTLSTVNSVQIMNLRSEMNTVTESFQTFQKATYAHKAQVLHLTEGQLKLAMELNYTQQAINRTMGLINEHSDILRDHDEAIRRSGEYSTILTNKLNAFMHNVEGQFLRSSVEDILRNKLNLDFIHHDDVPTVIEFITQATNISFEDNNSSISLLDLVTRLLVQQAISFIPSIQLKTSPYGVIIGNLLITSFFAASSYDERPFYVYQPIPIPFNYANKRVRLAQMPAYIGIHPDSRQFIRWSQEEAIPCYFEVMTSCRITPAIQKNLEDTCIYQILTDTLLTACRTEPYSESVFTCRIGHYWVISTNTTTTCHLHKIPHPDQHRVMDNPAITLPPIAIITTKDSIPLICDRFYLDELPMQSKLKMVLYQNATINEIDARITDLHSLMHNNNNWEKLPYMSSHIQAIVDYMKSTTQSPEILFMGRFQTHSILSFTLILIGLLILLIAFLTCLICYFRYKNMKKTRVKLTLPSWKTLELQELAAET